MNTKTAKADVSTAGQIIKLALTEEPLQASMRTVGRLSTAAGGIGGFAARTAVRLEKAVRTANLIALHLKALEADLDEHGEDIAAEKKAQEAQA